MFYLPSIVSGVVVSFFFTTFVSPQSFFPGFLEKLYNLDYPLYNSLVDSTFANKMVLLHMVWLTFPANLIIWGGTFSRIPESVIESSRLDGVNWVQEMFVIILPLVWPPNDGYYWIDNYGGKIEYIPPIPERDGYAFDGWYKESDCINKWDFETDALPQAQVDDQGQEIYQETKLYAKWTKN